MATAGPERHGEHLDAAFRPSFRALRASTGETLRAWRSARTGKSIAIAGWTDVEIGDVATLRRRKRLRGSTGA